MKTRVHVQPHHREEEQEQEKDRGNVRHCRNRIEERVEELIEALGETQQTEQSRNAEQTNSIHHLAQFITFWSDDLRR